MKFGVIGNDQMLLSCLQVLKETAGAEICFVLYDTRRINPMNPVDAGCEKLGILHKGITRLNTPEVTAFIRENRPDYLLSINNFFVIREEILDIPVKGTINFHNSVPSKYHGLNIVSWVVMNGEKQHGVMWHFVERSIDTGDVIVFEEFPLGKNETAASLMVKCIKKGIELFPVVLDQLFRGEITRTRQEQQASYFGKKDYPPGMGFIDFGQNAETIDRLVRGLNYLPFANPYLHAKIRHDGRELVVNAVEVLPAAERMVPGTVMQISDDEIHIACADAIINIADAMDGDQSPLEGRDIAEYFGWKTGDQVRPG